MDVTRPICIASKASERIEYVISGRIKADFTIGIEDANPLAFGYASSPIRSYVTTLGEEERLVIGGSVSSLRSDSSP